MDKTIEELEPCPGIWCRSTHVMLDQRLKNRKIVYWVECKDCLTRPHDSDTPEEAIRVWNTRADGLTELERAVVESAVAEHAMRSTYYATGPSERESFTEEWEARSQRLNKAVRDMNEARAKQMPEARD